MNNMLAWSSPLETTHVEIGCHTTEPIELRELLKFMGGATWPIKNPVVIVILN